MQEIERKFLLDVMPEGLVDAKEIEQAYLAREGAAELRIRRTAADCRLTVKIGSGLQRVEVEVELDEASFEVLWASEPIGGSSSRVIAARSAEFNSVRTADEFVPPGWFGTEVTGIPGWSNAEMAEHGRPPSTSD